MSNIKSDENNSEIIKELWANCAHTALKHYISKDVSYEQRIQWSSEAADDMVKQFKKRFG